MEKALVICGSTATGKTQLGVELAQRFNGEIVSADSRQVYKGMDISTGKELPANAKFKIQNSKLQVKNQNFRLGYYLFDGVPVWMLDVVPPAQSFSVADYCTLSRRVISNILKRGKLPIVVGGTGFYIKALTDGIETIGIPQNIALRAAYNNKSTSELLDILFHLNPDIANRLNPSEKKNKARLLRRIEIAQSSRKVGQSLGRKLGHEFLQIGLAAPRDVLRERINKRIDSWLASGAQDEIVSLLSRGLSWGAQSMSALGYRQWKPYFDGKVGKEEIVEKWKTEEWQYARRQITWFTRDKRITWFDITHEGWKEKVEETVGNWYNGD